MGGSATLEFLGQNMTVDMDAGLARGWRTRGYDWGANSLSVHRNFLICIVNRLLFFP